MFVHQIVLARRQRRDHSVFESSCHLSTTHGEGFTLSFLMQNAQQERYELQFLESGLIDPNTLFQKQRLYSFDP